MSILLILLVLLSIGLVFVPPVLGMMNIIVPEYVSSIIGAYIGAVFAVIGSIIFQNINDKKRNIEMFRKKRELIKKELYYNYIISVKMITQSDVKVEFSRNAYKKYVEDGNTVDDFGEIELFEAISKLYFIIDSGQCFCKSFNQFYEETFIKNHKVKSDYCQVYSILQSVGIDTIYELSIINYIITINDKFQLGLQLPFEKFSELIQYKTKRKFEKIKLANYYFVELIYQKIYGVNGRIYFNAVNSEFKDSIVQEGNDKIIIDEEMEMSYNKDYIDNYIKEKKSFIKDILEEKSIEEFLNKCDAKSLTVEHNMFKAMIRKLEKIVMDNKDIYLSFIGIKANEDAIDNFGRSRQQEFLLGKSKKYIVSERGWYKEVIERMSETIDPIVTQPYRDTSGSYVISIVKIINDLQDEVIGAFGIDILMINIFSKLNCKYRTIVITTDGEIVFHSHKLIKEVLENRDNINYLLEPFVLNEMNKNGSGKCESIMYGEKYNVLYDKIIDDRYFIMKLYKK